MAVALALVAAATSAQTIVDLDDVRQAITRGALLWDARDEDAFANGYIPGAVNLGDPTLTLRDTLTEDDLPTAEIEKALGAAGIDPAREIIVYGDRGLPSVYVAQLTLRHFGAANAHVFHEGIDGWRAAGHNLASKATKPKPVAVKLAVQPGVIVPTREVVAALKRSDVQILDVSTVKEFKGEDIRAIRGGHIPGRDQHRVRAELDRPGRARQAARRQSQGLVGHGAQAARRTGEAVREARPGEGSHRLLPERQSRRESAAVLADLGYRNVKVFDSSWPGYGSRLSASADDEVWTNFAALRLGRLHERHMRIEEAYIKLCRR
jgi:thiosulfate/3-mercaptopyruvate sulfurtransferase